MKMIKTTVRYNGSTIPMFATILFVNFGAFPCELTISIFPLLPSILFISFNIPFYFSR